METFLAAHATEQLVLDIGAGHVDTNHSYTNFFPNRHTVDIDEKRQPDTIADIHTLPFDANSFDFVLCTEVLEHCHTPQRAVDELYRVLRPGGKIILTTRFVYPLHDVPHDYFRFTKYGLQHLFRAWQSVDITPETQTFSALGALMQRVGLQTKLKGGRITKVFVYSFAWLFDRLNWLIRAEYGNIQKTSADNAIMTTGYYLVGKK